MAGSNYWSRFDPAGSNRWVEVVHGGDRGRAAPVEPTDGRWPREKTPFCESARGQVTPDGKTFLALVGDGAAVEGWDVSGRPQKLWSVVHPAKYPLPASDWTMRVVAASHDGSRFAIHSAPGGGVASEATVFSAVGGKAEPQMTIPMSESQRVWYVAALLPDGRHYAHSHRTHTDQPEVLDVTGKEPRKVGQLPNVIGAVRWMAYSPDGRHLAAAGDKGVAAFDAKTQQPVWKWDKSPGPIHWLDWAADGRHLVTYNGNKTVYVLRLNELGK